MISFLFSGSLDNGFTFFHVTMLFHLRDSLENQQSAIAKTKAQISFPVTAKLISAFAFASWIVQLPYFLNLKFPASSHLL